MIKVLTINEFRDQIRADLWRKPETPVGKVIGDVLQTLTMILAVLPLLLPFIYVSLNTIENLIFYPEVRALFGSIGTAFAITLAIWFVWDRIAVWIKADSDKRAIDEARKAHRDEVSGDD